MKDLFLLNPHITFLNHGSFGACPRPVFEDYQRWQRCLEEEPVQFMGGAVYEHLRRARETLGSFIGCSGDDLVFVPNPTTGVNTVMRSLQLQPGDEILSTNHEYGALIRAWTHYAKETGTHFVQREVRLPVTTTDDFVDQFWARVTDRTRVIFISQITSPTALIFPVAELCRRARERNILTIIDGAHVPGHIPLNIDELDPDVYTGAIHKWLCAPKGCSFLYVRRDLQPQIKPLVTSWGSAGRDPSTSPFLVEHQWQGTRDLSAFLTIPAAIQFQYDHLTDDVKQRCRHLTLKARQQLLNLLGTAPLSPATGTWLGQMASVELPIQDGATVQQKLYDDFRIEIPIFPWDGRNLLRVSIQAYNNEEDVDRLLSALKQLL